MMAAPRTRFAMEGLSIVNKSITFAVCVVALLLVARSVPLAAASEPVVPGTGQVVPSVGDNFEDTQWSYRLNGAKASEELDGHHRLPAGASVNGRWFEGLLRGQPDVVERVATPEGGIPGSEGSLLMRSLYTGVPGVLSRKTQQDDLIANVKNTVGGQISVSSTPNFAVRVYLPPFEEWENRTGNSFGIRAGVFAPSHKEPGKMEPYWPGMFIYFYSETDRRYKQDSAAILIRGQRSGRDSFGPAITETGWWTFGMSFTPDGQVHYYASPGIDALTPEDHLASQFPYGFRCQKFETFFFDVINGDNGQWSTPWIIDDPALYVNSPIAMRSRR